jgi:hypothetical protein
MHATPTPAPSDLALTTPVIEWDQHNPNASGSVEQRRFIPQMIESILQHQRIEDQPAIDAAMDDQAGRQFRLPLFDHEAFALLTGHGLPPVPMNREIEIDSIRKAR